MNKFMLAIYYFSMFSLWFAAGLYLSQNNIGNAMFNILIVSLLILMRKSVHKELNNAKL